MVERESRLGADSRGGQISRVVRIDETCLCAPRYSRLFQDRGRRIPRGANADW